MQKNELPELSGSCKVGSTSCLLMDDSRPVHLAAENNGRTLFIKIWYPADDSPNQEGRKERLWHELQNDAAVPGIMKLLLKRTTRIATNSYIQPEYLKEISRQKILIYSHGMISFAAENTYLMEDLASHGYIVISIQHSAQLEELQSLQKSQSKDVRELQAAIQKKIKRANGSERSRFSREYYESAANTNNIVSARAGDLEFVLKNMDRIMESIPGTEYSSPNTEAVGVMGLSLGGAVATDFAKYDNRVKFVVNMDGGIYGTRLAQPVTTPYLMLYSHANNGCNEHSLFAEDSEFIQCKTIEDTRHLNYHDISMIYPVLRRLGITGKVKPLDAIRLRNNHIIRFVRSNFDGDLGDEPVGI